MSQQQIILKQQLTVSEILRTYGKKFKQVQKRYSDGYNDRCAIGVIMSYFGWNGKDDSESQLDVLDKFKSNELKSIRYVIDHIPRRWTEL